MKMEELSLMVGWIEVLLVAQRRNCSMKTRADYLNGRRISRVLTRKDQRLPRLPQGNHKELCINLRLSRVCVREQCNEDGGRVENGGKERDGFDDAWRGFSDRGKGRPSEWSSDNNGSEVRGLAIASAASGRPELTYVCHQPAQGSSLMKMEEELGMAERLEADLKAHHGDCSIEAMADHPNGCRITRVLTHEMSKYSAALREDSALSHVCPEPVQRNSLMREGLGMVENAERGSMVYREDCLMEVKAEHLDGHRIPGVLTRKDQRLSRLPLGETRRMLH
jgi:hypothetical protein